MNTLLQSNTNTSSSHWALWVSPTSTDIDRLKLSDGLAQSKTLMMHPKKPEFLMTALLQALESGFYSGIKLAKSQLALRDQNILQLRAIRFGVALEWTDCAPRLNKASQLSLI